MNGKTIPLLVCLLLFVVLLACAGGGGSTAPITVKKTTEGKVSFAQTVSPILKDHCIRCHGADAKGGLSILDYEAVMKGGKGGGFVVPGDPDNSRLITSVEKTKPPFMPPKVSAERVAKPRA